jgi:hypothetical protein
LESAWFPPRLFEKIPRLIAARYIITNTRFDFLRFSPHKKWIVENII